MFLAGPIQHVHYSRKIHLPHLRPSCSECTINGKYQRCCHCMTSTLRLTEEMTCIVIEIPEMVSVLTRCDLVKSVLNPTTGRSRQSMSHGAMERNFWQLLKRFLKPTYSELLKCVLKVARLEPHCRY